MEGLSNYSSTTLDLLRDLELSGVAGDDACVKTLSVVWLDIINPGVPRETGSDY